MTAYDRTLYRDRLFPEGRPECLNRDGRPIYLGGRCSECYAATTPSWPGAHAPVPIEGPVGQLLCDVCREPVRTADGGKHPVHAKVV